MKKTMKSLQEELKKHDIHNDYNLLPKGAWLLHWRKSERGTTGGWIITKIGFSLKGAHYLDYGSLHLTGGKKSEVEKALDIAIARTGIKEWVQTPFGAWTEKETLAQALKILEEKNE